MVQEALTSDWKLEAIICEERSLEQNGHILTEVSHTECFQANSIDFKKLSSQQSPEGILAVVHFPSPTFCKPQTISHLPQGQGFLLEQLQDPGNLGTLIRTADWFGIPHIFCSEGTVDFLNPKTLRSSMGSIFRVKVNYIANWRELLEGASQRVWLADMDGTVASKVPFDQSSWVLLGNEANGISPETRTIPHLQKVHLPGSDGAESLNVAIAGGIFGYLMGGAD